MIEKDNLAFADNKPDNWPELEMKLRFLENILILSDLSKNGGNYGIDSNKNLKIVDFRVIKKNVIAETKK